MASATSAAAVAGDLPVSMAQLGAPPYRYVLLHLGWITVTKRSLNLALAFAGLTFAALQSASLCLVTTPPEGMARAVGRALGPLGVLGLPIKELVLTMLLALRFMATVSAPEQKAHIMGGVVACPARSGRLGRRLLSNCVVLQGSFQSKSLHIYCRGWPLCIAMPPLLCCRCLRSAETCA